MRALNYAEWAAEVKKARYGEWCAEYNIEALQKLILDLHLTDDSKQSERLKNKVLGYIKEEYERQSRCRHNELVLASVLDDLPDRIADTMRLYHFEGRTQEQAANILGKEWRTICKHVKEGGQMITKNLDTKRPLPLLTAE